MTADVAERSHLSIGEVLSLLQQEFPDVTISKIRFLESQGLLDPERTPSGYRKFYDTDIERLRWILRQQREHFLPLKVIKGRLERGEVDEPAPGPGDDRAEADADSNGDGDGDGHGDGGRTGRAGRAETGTGAAPRAPGADGLPAADGAVLPEVQAGGPPAGGPPGGSAAGVDTAAPAPTATPAGAPNPLDAGPTSVSLTRAELVAASGIDALDLDALERFGLVTGRPVGGEVAYDDAALVVARLAAGFLAYGVEARHLRMYKVAAEREAGFYEQVVMPLVKQRNPVARRQAVETLRHLAVLGQSLHAAMLRSALGPYTERG